MATQAPLLFVTSSPEKLRETGAALNSPLDGVSLELEEIQSASLEAVVRHKATHAFGLLSKPLLVEDTSLGFAAWGGLPGPFVKFFLRALGAEALARAVLACGDAAAEALSGFGYHDGRELHYFEGRAAGRIVSPRGAGGFGWDSIFQPDGAAGTYAEMTPGQKRDFSMRTRALERFRAFQEKIAGRP